MNHEDFKELAKRLAAMDVSERPSDLYNKICEHVSSGCTECGDRWQDPEIYARIAEGTWKYEEDVLAYNILSDFTGHVIDGRIAQWDWRNLQDQFDNRLLDAILNLDDEEEPIVSSAEDQEWRPVRKSTMNCEDFRELVKKLAAMDESERPQELVDKITQHALSDCMECGDLPFFEQLIEQNEQGTWKCEEAKLALNIIFGLAGHIIEDKSVMPSIEAQDLLPMIRSMYRDLFEDAKQDLDTNSDTEMRKRHAKFLIETFSEGLPTKIRRVNSHADENLINEAIGIMREVAAEIFEITFEQDDFEN